MAELVAEFWWVLILGVVLITGVSFSAPKRRRQADGNGDGASVAASSTGGDCGQGDAGGCDGGGD